MPGGKGKKEWTAVGAARAARDARVATMEFLRDAPVARVWEAEKMLAAFQVKVVHLRARMGVREAQAAASTWLFTGLGYSETWRPKNWMDAAETVVSDEARYLAEADLYILSPRMCDVVVAAAQTLTSDDLDLLTEDDLPSRSGLVVLPHPLLVKAINGNLADDRAYLWRAPVPMSMPDQATGGWKHVGAVRTSLYHDTHGPVRPDSFLDFAAHARAQGHPLPPLLLDAVRCYPFETVTEDEQDRTATDFISVAQHTGQRLRDVNREHGVEEQRVIGEYVPGSEINDRDDSFSRRFLYAFWRLCEQRIASTHDAEVRHAARVTAERAGVSPDVRVVELRPTAPHATENPVIATADRWRHRWIVRMHKVRQWYPSEQRHKVLYRGPYPKGPDDKPLLGGDTVTGLLH